MNRRIFANLAVFTIISFAFIFWALTNILHVAALEHPFTVKADFPAAFGVLKNSEVTYLGTQIGEVRTTRRIPHAVEVDMAFKRGARVPSDAHVQIARKSAIGEPFVNFTPAPGTDGRGPFLRNGDTVPIERATVPIEFSELLRAASGLVEAIPPDDLHTVIKELAVGLNGRGDDLRTLITAGDTLASSLADRTTALDRLAVDNTRLTSVLANHSGSLETTLADLRQIAASLANVKDDIGPLLDRGNALLADLNPLVQAHVNDLGCVLSTVGRVVKVATTPERIAGLQTTLDQLPTAFDDVLDATDVEDAGGGSGLRRWLRINILVNTNTPPPQFVPPKPEPIAFPTIVPCAAVAGTTSTPTAFHAAPGAAPVSTPATGGHQPIGTALAALALAIGIGRIRRR